MLLSKVTALTILYAYFCCAQKRWQGSGPHCAETYIETSVIFALKSFKIRMLYFLARKMPPDKMCTLILEDRI